MSSKYIIRNLLKNKCKFSLTHFEQQLRYKINHEGITMQRFFLNPLMESIPEFMIANRNHTAKGAWRSNHHPAPLGCSKGNTTATGRATSEDIASGWAGHLTTREMKDRWDRRSEIPIGNNLDNYHEKIFNLRWSRTWQLRALTGWTPLAALDLEMDEHEYHFNDVDQFGAPHWWTLSEFV